ncbi:transporter substrate-binding domain-containing protein [Desulforhopalus sp. 52FAK]
MIYLQRFLYLSVFLPLLLLLSGQLSYGETDHLLTVKVGVYENPPKVYTNANGDVAGIFPDILEVIAGEEGWHLEYVHGTWEEGLKRLSLGEIDVMVDIAFSKKRAKKMLFTKENIFLNWGCIYTREGLVVESLIELKGKTVATVKGDIHSVGESGILQLNERFDLGLKFVFVDSYAEALAQVETGEADAGVVNRLFGIISEDLYAVQKSSVVFNSVRLKYAFSPQAAERNLPEAVDDHVHRLKQNPESVFHEIINSYLAGIEYDLDAYQDMKPLDLTNEELEWLKTGHSIRVGVDPAFAPYSYRDTSGAYQGLVIDILQLVTQHLGLNIEIAQGLSWRKIMEGARKNELDLILTAAKLDSRLDFMNFSDVYLPTPLVIMTRENNFTIEGPEDIEGKRVALVNGYAVTERLLNKYPGLSPVMVENPLAGLAAVSAGEADCYVGVLGVVDYLLRKGGISNLKVAGRFDMLCTGQSVAVRKDWPILLTILDKAFKAISEKKKSEIHDKWIFSLSLLDGPAALQEENALTKEETEWVLEHRDITLGADPEFAPFEFFDQSGRYQGIAAEYVQILNRRLGLNMEVVPELSWKQVNERAKQGEIDVLPIVGKTRERQEYLNYTKPYMSYHRVVITRSDMPFISSVEDIKDLNIAVQEHSSHQGFLKEMTSLNATEYPTLLEGLKAVSEGKEDAYVGNLTSAMYWIRKVGLTNLKVAGPVSYSQEHLYFSVRKDWPELVGIIEKGLASISSSKEKEIRERWVEVEYEPGVDPHVVFEYFLEAAFVILFIIMLILASNKRLKKEILRRERVEKDLTYKLLSEQLLSRIASRVIHLKEAEISAVLENTLRDIAELMRADSAYLLNVAEDGKEATITSSQMVKSATEGDRMFSSVVPIESNHWVESIDSGKAVIYGNSMLGAALDRSMGTSSHPLWESPVGMILPILRGDSLFALLWFTSADEEVDWQIDDAIFLETIGNIISNSLGKVDIDRELQKHQQHLEEKIAERTDELAKANLKLIQEIADKIEAEEEKDELQGQLLHTQKMESIGTLAGGIAHEFNNILTVILGNTEVTRGLCPPGSVARNNLDRILSAGGRAKNLVSQILTFSRESKTRPQLIDPVEAVFESLQMLRPTLPSTIEIQEQYKAEEKQIFIDPGEVHQILINLCTNASHAMEEKGGVLTVVVDEQFITVEGLKHSPDIAPGRYVEVRVSDSGCGIDQIIMRKIFDPFFTTKKVGKGTGLGLSIVHGIVKKAGGFITVKSKEGEGTTFQMFFPSLPARREEQQGTVEHSLQGNERILLVDDEEEVVATTSKLIKTMGYQVTVAVNGQAALEQFVEQPEAFDLVITDQTMPKLTGVELTKKLREIRPDLPVILCTGYSSLIDQEKAESMGVSGFILKPFSRREIGQMIRKLCDYSR